MRLRVAHVVCPPEGSPACTIDSEQPHLLCLASSVFQPLLGFRRKVWLCGFPLSMTDAKEQPQHLPLMYPHDTAT